MALKIAGGGQGVPRTGLAALSDQINGGPEKGNIMQMEQAVSNIAALIPKIAQLETELWQSTQQLQKIGSRMMDGSVQHMPLDLFNNIRRVWPFKFNATKDLQEIINSSKDGFRIARSMK